MSRPFPIDQIVRADPADAIPLACLIAEAFHLLAPSIWLIPDDLDRREVFPAYFEMYVREALENGVVDTVADLSAVALWIANPGARREPAPGYDDQLTAVTGMFVPQFRVFDGLLDAHHPAGEFHHHLAILAVHPKHQRCGMGTALLERHHRELDQAGTPAYLEASDEGTRELYLRHGYTDLGDPIALPDGPRMYPMVRAARQG